jgi:hypothetical protein
MVDTLEVRLSDPTADDDRLDGLAIDLREELLSLDVVDDVSRTTDGAAPAGSRAIEVAALGALVISLGQSSDAIGKVLAAIRSWLKRDPMDDRTVKLTLGDRTIELSNATDEQQARLVEAFLRGDPAGDRAYRESPPGE